MRDLGVGGGCIVRITDNTREGVIIISIFEPSMGITDYDMHVLSKASGSNPVDIHRPVEI